MLEHIEDLDADFLAIYGIDDAGALPAWRFFSLAERLFFFQGTMQARVMERQEEQAPQRQPSTASTYGPSPTKADGTKEEEVKVVPLAGLLAMMPGLGSYSQVPK